MNIYGITQLPAYETARLGEGGKIVNAPDRIVWGGDSAPPAIGTRVKVRINKLGSGVVIGYFVEGRYLGVEVKPDKQPEWHLKQNGPVRCYHVFAPEFDA